MPEGDQAGDKFEDLFEDLDKFFAPIEQVDRPLRDPLPGSPVPPAGASGLSAPVEPSRSESEARSEPEFIAAAAGSEDRDPGPADSPSPERPIESRDETPAEPDWMYG